MHQRKYYKYKNKYLELKKRISETSFTPNLEDADPYHLEERNNNDDDILVQNDTPEFPFNLPTDTDSLTPDQQDSIEITDFSDTVGQVEESDEDPGEEAQPQIEISDGIADVGIFGLARGRSEKIYNITNFIKYSQGTDPTLILKIDNINDFDNFTYKYGAVTKDDTLYIRWDKVQKDYKGLYLDEGIRADRQDDSYYNNKYYPSWWGNEFTFEVLIFVKEDFTLVIGKIITVPFSGKIHNENDFTPEMYVDFTETSKSEPDKIVRLSSFNSFDDFTKRYGYVKVDDNNKSYIAIRWDDVSSDYKGFYIDKDAEVYPERFSVAFFDGEKYTSWWKKDNIRQLVYVFKK